jgi:hypothetical protein
MTRMIARILCIMFVSITLTFLPSTIFASLTSTAGLESNLILVNGVVIFVQAGGSLTSIRVDTGEVLVRRPSTASFQELTLNNAGIIAKNYSQIALLDTTTLEEKWRDDRAYKSQVIGSEIITWDNIQIVKCRDIPSGKILWTYEFSNVENVVAVGKNVLIHRSGISGNFPALVVLDVDSGKESLRLTPPSGTSWINSYFDGIRIYVLETHSAPDDWDALPRIIILNLGGERIREYPEKMTTQDFDFVLEGKHFLRTGEVLEDVTNEKATKLYELAAGNLEIQNIECADKKMRSIARLEKGGREIWSGFASSMDNVCSTESRILWSRGLSGNYIECIDAKSGHALWIYRFAFVSEVVSYSYPDGMPASYACRAESHFDSIANRHTPESFVLLNDGVDPVHASMTSLMARSGESHPTIVEDPHPFNIFQRYRYYQTIGWAGVGGPAFFLLIIMMMNRKGKLGLPVTTLLSGLLMIVSLVTFWSLHYYAFPSCWIPGILIFAMIGGAFVNIFRLARMQTRFTVVQNENAKFSVHITIKGVLTSISVVGLLYLAHRGLLAPTVERRVLAYRMSEQIKRSDLDLSYVYDALADLEGIGLESACDAYKQTDNPRIKRRLIRFIGFQRTTEAYHHIENIINDHMDSERRAAVQMLPYFNLRPDALDLAVRTLHDSDLSVARVAASQLENFRQPGASKALFEIIEETKDFKLLGNALQSLGRTSSNAGMDIQRRAVAVAQSYLEHGQPEVREGACLALRFFRTPENETKMLPLLNDSEIIVRKAAATGIQDAYKLGYRADASQEERTAAIERIRNALKK